MTKAELRKQIRLLKQQYTAEELKKMSQHAIQRMEAHPSFISAQTVLLYHAHELELHIFDAECKTKTGVFGIIESEGQLFTDYSQIDLAIIPGMAFDKEGNRLGRGKGYYDRLLPQLHCPKIGLCFSFQYFDSIPYEKHDKSMDEIITT